MNAAPAVSKDDFDWRSDDSIVLREQLSIAAYVNTMGSVVIRREMLWDEEQDTVICFRPECVDSVCDALKAAAREALEAERLPDGDEVAPARVSRKASGNGHDADSLPFPAPQERESAAP